MELLPLFPSYHFVVVEDKKPFFVLLEELLFLKGVSAGLGVESYSFFFSFSVCEFDSILAFFFFQLVMQIIKLLLIILLKLLSGLILKRLIRFESLVVQG